MGTDRLYAILGNLQECFDGHPWYGDALMAKLDAIPFEHVNEPRYGQKSIAILVRHIVNWRVFVLKKLQGDADYDLEIDGPNDWSYFQLKSRASWDALKAELRATQKELLQTLSDSNDAILGRKVPGKTYTFGDVLPSIAQHDIYHLGQIAMLNNWPTRTVT